MIHVSSAEAVRALPYQSAYASSKHGVHGFLQALRLELEHERIPISVTEVMPTTVNTPLYGKERTKLGVRGVGMPPIYQPRVVADVILHAAEHPSRKLAAGGAGKALILGQRLSPRLMDASLLRAGFRSQKTDEPKSEDDPDNLFGPVEGHDMVEGDFGSRAFSKSLHNRLEMRPGLKRATVAGAALLAAAAAFGTRAGRDGGSLCTSLARRARAAAASATRRARIARR